jgi:hypothetical protein
MFQLLQQIKKKIALLLSGGGPDYSSRLQAGARPKSQSFETGPVLEYFGFIEMSTTSHHRERSGSRATP